MALLGEAYSRGGLERVRALASFSAAHSECFQLAASIGAAEKRTLLTQLAGDLHTLLSSSTMEEPELLGELLCVLRICIREREGLEPVESNSFFITDLMTCVAPSNDERKSYAGFTQESSLQACKCLLNLLHLAESAADLFIQAPNSSRHSINGLHWLVKQIWQGGRPSHLLYMVRTLYMLYSKRETLIEQSFQRDEFSGLLETDTLYHVLVTATVATCYKGGKVEDGLGSLALNESHRALLFQELCKILYLIRSNSEFPQHYSGNNSADKYDPATDDFELQQLAMHVLLMPHLCPGHSSTDHSAAGDYLINTHSFSCKISSLQILMVVANPSSELFEKALTRLALTRVLNCDLPTTLISYADKSDCGVKTVHVPVLLIPLLRSLLMIFELQLYEVACSIRGGLESIVSTSSASKVIPILTILTSLAENGDDHLRSLLLRLLCDIPFESNIVDSSGVSASDKNLFPKQHVRPFSLYSKILTLMTSLEPFSKRYASEFMFALCGKNAERFVAVTGLGNAISLLQTKGLFGM